VDQGRLKPNDTLVIGKPWPERISVAGIALDDAKQILYAVTKENNSLYLLNMKTGQVIGKYPLDAEGYTCLLSPDRKFLYISCWGCNKVEIFDTGKQVLLGL